MTNKADCHKRAVGNYFKTKILKLDLYTNTIIQEVKQKIQTIEEISTNIITDSNANAIDYSQKAYHKHTSQVTQDMEQTIDITKLKIITTTKEQDSKWISLNKTMHIINDNLIKTNVIAIKNYKVMTNKVASLEKKIPAS